MDLFAKLAGVFASPTSPPVEKTLAEALIRSPQVDSFLSELKKAKLVIVVTGGVPKVTFSTFVKEYYNDAVIFPTPVLEVLSTSPAMTARLASSTVCSLIDMLIGNNNGLFKGVLALSSGISLDNLSFPGSMVWTLERIPQLTITSSTYTVVICSSFTNYITMTPYVSSLRLGPFPSDGVSEISKIAEAGRNVINVQMTSGNDTELLSLASKTLPPTLRTDFILKVKK